MFRIEMLPAGHGDCLWIEYGSAESAHRVLIDGGLASTYPDLRNRILALPKAERVFELLIITHVDNDHIEGVIPLLQDTDLGCRFHDVWYNGWRHLRDLSGQPAPEDILGPREGEFIGVLLTDQKLPWNEAFSGGRIEIPAEGDLPVRELAGLKLTVLSPTRPLLTNLKERWRSVATDANFTPGDIKSIRAQLEKRRYLRIAAGELGDDQEAFGTDNSEANGSSIVVLAEFDGVKALLTGDAHAEPLLAALKRLGATPQKPLAVDAWKLAHHGSRNNFSEELLAHVRARRYLISTDGRKPYLHPHSATLETIIERHSGRSKPQLVFNYRSVTTEPWTRADHPQAGKFVATYPTGTVLML